MHSIKSFVSFVKNNPGKVAVAVVLGTLAFGGVIAGVYNKVRAKVPALPAPNNA